MTVQEPVTFAAEAIVCCSTGGRYLTNPAMAAQHLGLLSVGDADRGTEEELKLFLNSTSFRL
ncbi:hypothetical protein HY339_02375 [Candidatus Gottesmanbacteria bacterium]|nr:hypothetical protein [Candidatus Gottesmanbacteria bacterium]